MKRDRIFIRGHHLSTLAREYFEEEKSLAPFLYPNTLPIYKEFKDNPNLLVEIVCGFDSICEAQGAEECPDFKNSCVFQDIFWDDDVETLKEYELKAGSVYLASDIIETFIDYYNRTGYISPAAKSFFERRGKLK